MSAPWPKLVAITDTTCVAADELVARCHALLERAAAGTVAVLLRDRQASALTRLQLGRELRRATRATRQELWVADRLGLALALEADGLHLGEESVAASEARRLWPSRLSRAWHDLTFSDSGALDGVDALLVSPVIEARKGRSPLGLPGLEAACRRAGLERVGVYALGGVDAHSAAACVAAGARGVAAIGAAWGDDALELLAALKIAR